MNYCRGENPAAIVLNGLFGRGLLPFLSHFFKLTVDILLGFRKQIVLIFLDQIAKLAIVGDEKRTARHSERGA